MDLNNPEYFEYAGAAGGHIDRLGYPYCKGRIFNNLEKDNGQYNQDSKVFWASGACFFVRKKSFKYLGGFDEDFFEDNDWLSSFSKYVIVDGCELVEEES